MSKLTWKDLEEKNIAIHTPTEDLMKKIANVIAKRYGDLTYEEYLESNKNFDTPDDYRNYKENTSIDIFMGNNNHYIWTFCPIDLYMMDGYQIVEYEEVRHLFKDYINTTETKEIKYLAKIKLKNGEEGYFMEEWDQGEHWLSPVEEFKYADMYTNLTSLKEILDIYKEEIEEYKIIKQTTTTTKTFEFVKQLKGENNNER